MWIAFKSLYLWYSEQPGIKYTPKKKVVNCFQKFVSLIFWTTNVYLLVRVGLLWIAFKSLYLWYSEQHGERVTILIVCCELLSKVCIFDILNNKWISTEWIDGVVNCFQKFVSLIFWTTNYNRCHGHFGCELLSKVCIFDILNNERRIFSSLSQVVNCFQKFVSLIFWTTL